jgi:hypothetical protein
MHSERASVWFVPANGGAELAVLVKAPTTCIKALVSGCDISLVVSVHEGVLSAGFRIYDVPEAPVLICGVVRHSEEHVALMRLAVDKTSAIFLFNELDANVAWSNVTVSECQSELIVKLLADKNLYSGPFTPRESDILDRFCLSIDPTLATTLSGDPIDFSELRVSIETWRVNHISYVGIGTHNDLVVDNVDEGGVFEAAAWATLKEMFSSSLWRSPIVTIGNGERELADVMAYYDYGTFLVEAKDLAVLTADPLRTRARRVAGTIKQAKKAIGQLVGASKALRRGETVRDLEGNVLAPVITQPMHCIILLERLTK